MDVRVEKLTDVSLMHRAIESTVLGDMESKLTLDKIYQCKHSPIRTQLFWVEFIDLYSYVSTHLVRHKIGVEHFVSSRREDRGGSEGDGRYSLVKHSMLINAQSLINLAHARLCYQASSDTTNAMIQLRTAITRIDIALAKHLVPRCEYLGRCEELRPCGYWSSKDD